MNKIMYLFLIFCILMFNVSPISVHAVTGDDIINYANNISGSYSSSNRRGPASCDCSGFVWYVCLNVGLSISSGSTEQQKNYGTHVDYTN